MKANVLNSDGKAQVLCMGCYGIGVSRLVAASIEQNYDEKGIVWPHSIAPFDINIISIGHDKNKDIEKASMKLYKDLTNDNLIIFICHIMLLFGYCFSKTPTFNRLCFMVRSRYIFNSNIELLFL